MQLPGSGPDLSPPSGGASTLTLSAPQLGGSDITLLFPGDWLLEPDTALRNVDTEVPGAGTGESLK